MLAENASPKNVIVTQATKKTVDREPYCICVFCSCFGLPKDSFSSTLLSAMTSFYPDGLRRRPNATLKNNAASVTDLLKRNDPLSSDEQQAVLEYFEQTGSSQYRVAAWAVGLLQIILGTVYAYLALRGDAVIWVPHLTTADGDDVLRRDSPLSQPVLGVYFAPMLNTVTCVLLWTSSLLILLWSTHIYYCDGGDDGDGDDSGDRIVTRAEVVRSSHSAALVKWHVVIAGAAGLVALMWSYGLWIGPESNTLVEWCLVWYLPLLHVAVGYMGEMQQQMERELKKLRKVKYKYEKL